MKPLLLLAILLVPHAVQAQAQPPVPAPDQETDVSDLYRAWRKKDPKPPAEAKQRMIIAAPVIGSNPSAGFVFGVAGQMSRYWGDPATTRISSGIASLSFSTKKQTQFNVRFDTYTSGNRWVLEGDNRFQRTSQNVYGFGTDTPESSAIGARFNFVRVYETVFRRVAGDVYLGGGFLFDSHTSVEPADEESPAWPSSPYNAYNERHGFPADGQQSAGFSANVLLNRRDNDINARRGWRAEARYRMSFDGFLGGDSSWQQLDTDLRGYVPLSQYGRHRIALWTYTSLVTSGVAPYFDAPASVMDTYGRSARAYREGRYRGEKLVYGEAEYRGPLMRNGLVGVVAFATMTTVSNEETGEKLFDSVAPSAGAGLRLLLSKRSRTNLCLDFAWGRKGSSGVYLGIQEAF